MKIRHDAVLGMYGGSGSAGKQEPVRLYRSGVPRAVRAIAVRSASPTTTIPDALKEFFSFDGIACVPPYDLVSCPRAKPLILAIGNAQNNPCSWESVMMQINHPSEWIKSLCKTNLISKTMKSGNRFENEGQNMYSDFHSLLHIILILLHSSYNNHDLALDYVCILILVHLLHGHVTDLGKCIRTMLDTRLSPRRRNHICLVVRDIQAIRGRIGT